MAYEKNVTFSVDITGMEMAIQNRGGQWTVTIHGTLEGPNGERYPINQRVNLGDFPEGGTGKTFSAHLTHALDAALTAEGFSVV